MRLGTAICYPESRHHLVEDQQGAGPRADLAKPLQESRLRQHETHVAGHRLDDDRRNVAGASRNKR
jgi:hypothetical protein